MLGKSLLALALLVSAGAAAARDYAVGQVWQYHVRSGDEGSLLRIQAIETPAGYEKYGPIYHISVIGVHFPGVPGGQPIGHLPVSRETLEASVTQLSPSKDAFPDWQEGVKLWRADRGGVFTISLAEIVTIVERSVLQQTAQRAGTQ